MITSMDTVQHWHKGAPDLEARTDAPRIIWSYWDSEDVPGLVSACFRSWRDNAPGFEIRVLNKRTAVEIVGTPPRTFHHRPPQMFADWLRLRLLRDFGGIWLDASFIMATRIENAFPGGILDGRTPFMFRNNHWTTDASFPMMENWLIFAPAGDPLIAAWYRSYSIACWSRSSAMRLIKAAGLTSKLFQACRADKHFLSCAALQLAMRYSTNVDLKHADPEVGPMQLQASCGYDMDGVIAALCDDEAPIAGSVKLTAAWRNAVSKRLAISPAKPSSIMGRVMNASPSCSDPR